MEFTETTYNGFRQINFNFEDRLGILVCPKKPLPGNKWLYTLTGEVLYVIIFSEEEAILCPLPVI